MSTIYNSSLNNSQEIQIQENDRFIYEGYIQNNNIKIDNNKITGIDNPIEPKDAVNLNYLITRLPNFGNNLIIFNKNDTFTCDNEITFNNNILQADEFLINDTISFSEGTITGLSEPTLYNQAATKSYVDNLYKLNQTTIKIGIPILNYPAEQMYNSILYRDPVFESDINTKLDITADAESIISLFPDNSIGNSTIFILSNINTNNVSIYLKPGNNVNFNNTDKDIIIPAQFIMVSRLIITGINNILLYIEYIGISTIYNNCIFNNSFSTDNLIVNQNIFYYYYDNPIYNNSIQIFWEEIFQGQATKTLLTQNTDIYLPTNISNLGSYSGLYTFILRNANPNYSLTLKSNPGWILDSYSNFIIPHNKSILLWFYLTGNSIIVYNIGILNI